MKTTIDIKKIRYLNIFEKITNVRSKDCFFYNNIVFFVIKQKDLFKAIGKNSKNLKEISKVIGKKIKVIPYTSKLKDAPKFIKQLISPIEINNIIIENGIIKIEAGSRQNKAILIGREKKRLEEMKEIIKNFFGLDLQII
ncbi:MAG: NusA-like transcription termination signal-binding factor [Candidatus Pacearchaeota archaeon]